MSWNIEMDNIERKYDWRAAVGLLKRVSVPPPELYLRVMFLLLDFVVEVSIPFMLTHHSGPC